MKKYLINNINDANYLQILQDFRQNFAGKIVYITTNYKLISSFKVSFDELNLPHLMGWSKVLNTNKSATNIIHLIDDEKLTLANTRRNSNFFKIRDRLLNYNFLYNVFYDRMSDICVMTSNMRPNKLNLDIVFYQFNDKKHIVVLGLRKQKNTEYFVPTTLHVENAKNSPYLNRRKTIIKSVNWI